MREKLNGDIKEGFRFLDEFFLFYKLRRKDLLKGDVDEYEKRLKRVLFLENFYKLSDKVEEVYSRLLYVFFLKCRFV